MGAVKKHCLVSGVVLIALAVIALPVIWSHSTFSFKTTQSKFIIPARPPVPEVKPHVFTKVSSLPDLKPVAWVILLASYPEKSSAHALQQQLVKQGYHAYYQQRWLANKPEFQVLIGPETDRKLLQQQLAHMQQQNGLKGQVIPFIQARR